MKKNNLSSLVVIGVLVVIIALGHFYVTAIAQPGEANDPLVTRRYVNDRISELNNEINRLRNVIYNIDPSLLAAAGTGTTTGTGNFSIADRDALFADIMVYFEHMYGDIRDTVNALVAATDPTPIMAQVVPFDAVFARAGQTLIAEAGVEFILRSGQATAISGVNGIVDMTAGRDVINGQAIIQNHLMIVPATDGRGMVFNTDAWIMIKGSYQIVN